MSVFGVNFGSTSTMISSGITRAWLDTHGAMKATS